MPYFSFQPVNYAGFEFSDFYAARDYRTRDGWYVFGRNSEKYGRRPDGKGSYVMLVARPGIVGYRPKGCEPFPTAVKGWRTKREAQAIADMLNAA
jgi:hypothetical protein